MNGKFNWYAFPYPVLVTAVYLGIGFIWNAWHPAWLIFMTIPIYYTLITMNNTKGFRAKANVFPYPIICTMVFLVLGFDYMLWHPAWMLFITIPIYYMIVNAIRK